MIKIKSTKVSIYCNIKKDYVLIVPSAPVENSDAIRVQIEPVFSIQDNITDYRVGKYILQALDITRNAKPVSKAQGNSFVLGEITGIKSFSKFTKQFRSITVTKNENNFVVRELARDPKYGGYIPTDNSIELDVSSSVADIGKCALKLFSLEYKPETILSGSFLTLGGKRITFTIPSDDYINADDGGIDAYQIYKYYKNDGESAYMGFFHNVPYSDINESEVRRLWHFYGNLVNMEIKKVCGGLFEYEIIAETSTSLVRSFLFRDEDGFSELLLFISKSDLSVQERLNVIKDFQYLMTSSK